MKSFKLEPKSSLHLGIKEGRLEGTEVFVHSDTLFSAVCHSYLLLYGKEKLQQLLKKFAENNPPFLISSCFPFWKGKFYFPVPKNQIPEEKHLKKVQFVAKGDFEKLLQGEKLNKEMATIPDLNAKENQPRTPYQTQDVPRVALSRFSAHPGEEFFHSGEVWYRENSGLFFLVDFKSSDIEKEFNATISLIADEGIGGDRTSGKGLFKQPEQKEISISLPENADGSVSLALYYPTKEEIPSLEKGYYELLERKGYIYSPQCQSLRRKSVRMFTEGSVFPQDERRGDLVKVTPEKVDLPHQVYRYGFIFPIPCKLSVRPGPDKSGTGR